MAEHTCKDIVIIETNFVVGYSSKEFNSIVDELSEKYDVYITQVSIDERLAQRYILHKGKYDDLAEIAKKYCDYADITLRKDFNEFIKVEKERSIALYKEKFGSNIIGFKPDDNCLNIVIERAYKKIAPFNPDPKSSDKGFKDTLIWLSLLQYFENNKSSAKVVFLSSDRAFTGQEEVLKDEFMMRTGMEIEICQNSYYKTLLGQYENHNDNQTESDFSILLTDEEKKKLRKTLAQLMENITTTWFQDEPYGQAYEVKRFTIHEIIDDSITEEIIDNLSKFLEDNIFSENVFAGEWLAEYDISLSDRDPIPLEDLEKLDQFIDSVNENHPRYVPKLISAITKLMNTTYKYPVPPIDESEDLPF